MSWRWWVAGHIRSAKYGVPFQNNTAIRTHTTSSTTSSTEQALPLWRHR